MAYVPLQLPPSTPLELREFVKNRIDPLFHDIHSMFRLPIEDVDGLDTGCNLTIANSLLDIVAGASVLREKIEGIDSTQPGQHAALFHKCLEKHFPWSEEPVASDCEALVGLHASNILYKAFRNPLTHRFGVNVGEPGRSSKHGKAKVAKGPLAESEIVEIEQAENRPPEWSRPTLYTNSLSREDREKTVLVLKCFYWGVRKMVVGVINELAESAPRTLGVAATESTTITATATTTFPILGGTSVNSGPT